MKTRIFLLLTAILCCSQASAQSLTNEQQKLMQDISTYLKTRNLVPQLNPVNPSELYFAESNINYALKLDPENNAPMYLSLTTTYNLPEAYDPAILQQVAQQLNVSRGVKCLSTGRTFSFLAEWYLLDYSAFRYSYGRIHEQILDMASRFSPLYTEFFNRAAHGGAGGINQGVPGQTVLPSAPAYSVVPSAIIPSAAVPSAAVPSPTVPTATVPTAAVPAMGQLPAATLPALQSTPATPAAPVTEEVIFDRPTYNTRGKRRLDVNYVKLQPDRTILELTSYSEDDRMTYKWCSVSPDACLVVGGVKYKLIDRENIAMSPSSTFYSMSGKLTFRLIFDAIPSNSQRIDFINDPDRQWYLEGIYLKRDK